jgi:hypothetical protein
LPACLQCTTDFPAPAARRGKVQVYCSRPCQTKAANARRASTRKGRVEGITYPHAGKAPGQPLLSTPPNIPPTVDRSVSDSPSARIAELMALAHSRTGINAWEIAELAKLRGISPWAPLRVIIAP